MKSYFNNGGIIGSTVDIGDTSQYQTGTEEKLETLVYVGGQTTAISGTTSTGTVTFNLTGGVATAPAANDIVLVAYTIASNSSINPPMSITGYTNAFSQLFVTDTQSTKFGVAYKIMGSTPDTNFTRSQTGNTQHAGAIAVHVWRNVDTTTPLDVTSTTSTTTNSILVNPPAITPVTSNSVILVAGGGAHALGTETYTASYLSNFRTVGSADNVDALVGMGSILWTGGTYDPAQWTFSDVDSTAFSCASATLALRPKLTTIPTFGNKKNSGMWNLNAAYDESYYNYPAKGEALYIYFPPGTYYFPVPPGVTQISGVCIGGGGGGGGGETGRDEGVTGGGGGGCAWGTFDVTPNELLTLVIGAGGNGGGSSNDGQAGGATQILRGSTVLLQGGGGQGGQERSTATRTGGTSTGTARQGGGNGGSSSATTNTGGGGGGAGGYTGNGGNGGSSGAGTSGAGGGGGGGGATNAGTGYGGGGTFVYGEYTSGAGGALNQPGFGGSFGEDSVGPDGGYPGGGGGGCDDDTNGAGGNGADGAIGLIWNFGATYPNTNYFS